MPHLRFTPPRLLLCPSPARAPRPAPLNGGWATSAGAILFPHGIPTPIRPLSTPAGARPGFLLFVFGVFGPLGLSSASFSRTLRWCSRAIHARLRSGHAPPGLRLKYFSSPLSHAGRVALVRIRIPVVES